MVKSKIPKHHPIWNNLGNQTRYFIITGGRGSGKSFEVARFTTLLSFQNNHKILFTRQTMTSAHLSIIPEFLEKIDLLNLSGMFTVTKNEIENTISKSKIVFRGIRTSSGDQTANLKSLQGVTSWILEEAEEQNSETIFDKINFSIRSKVRPNRIIKILNPTSKTHFIYKRFFEEAGVQPGFTGQKGDVTYIHTTYLNNLENLSESFIKEAEEMKINNPVKYNHIMLGGWLDKSEGVIFTNWELGDFVNCGTVVFGQDYGFNIAPTTLVKCSVDSDKKIIYVHECINAIGLTTTQIYELDQKHAEKHLIIADSAEPRLIAELRQRGLNIKGITKPLIIDRIALLQDYKIIVTPESINIIKELNNYVWHERKSATPVDMYNDNLDAIGYVIWEMAKRPTYKLRVR